MSIVLPSFVQDRIAVWDRLKASKAAATAAQAKAAITITLPDGKQVAGVAHETTPLQVAEQISAGLARSVLAAQVNGVVWDLTRALEADCSLALLKFESDDAAKHVFWHSSAHILGQALELAFGGQLCIGPPLENGGFYYDVATKEPIAPADFERVQAIVSSIIKEGQPFERLVITKAEALELFAANKYKVELIGKKVKDGELTSAYRCGPLIDLCRGPHLPNTKKVEAFKVTKNSAAYWLGNPQNDSLQRVYGISFPVKKQLKEWEEFQEKAAKRDHRLIGKNQELFFFDPLSPGSAFWLPHGTRIYTKLVDYMREQYRKRGFSEVITPNVYNHELWYTSGHLPLYEENMFNFKTREQENFALKPMNCFRESDHQILTSRGFLFLDEVEQAVARDAAGRVVDWRGLAVANYNRAANKLVYQQPRALVVKRAGADRMIEFASADGEFHIVVTEHHDMFVGDAAGSPASFRKVPAKQLLAKLAGAPLAVSLLCSAPVENSSLSRAELRSVVLVGADEPHKLAASAAAAAVVRVREVPSDGSRSWCFDMNDGFVVTRRAERVSHGSEWVVLKASRATIQGNCPGHCVMFKNSAHSYRELPIRYADFGVLHRNEASGALGGLTRVRRFCQDDAHIFCMPSQILQEVASCIDFVEHTYGIFQFKFDIELSTRPEKFLGEIAVWDKAEEALRTVLDDYSKRTGKSWRLNPGDGAFYGPKLDIHIKDAIGRSHQCATIQLDFQLPIRFELKYASDDGAEDVGNVVHRPVIIHRAIFGSLERFTGILMEHVGGRWPLWISPRQVAIVPIAPKCEPYAENVVRKRILDAGFFVDVIGGDKTMQKRIAEASKAHYNYIVVVGDKEIETESVNVRPRPKDENQKIALELKTIAEFIAELKAEADSLRPPADADWLTDDKAPAPAKPGAVGAAKITIAEDDY
jgi:threonyl-tRNA synthetase